VSGPRPTLAGHVRVAVVRALPGLGDLLCAVPALRGLRATWPSARVTLVGLAGAAWFVERFSRYVDDLLPCDVWPGLAEIDGPSTATAPFLERARRRRFDLAIQMHGDGRASNALTAALGATRWIGLSLDDGAPPPDGVVGHYRLDHHEIDRCVDVLGLVGVTAADRTLEMPVREADVLAAGRLVEPDLEIALVHPGASTAARRWSPIGFGGVVEHLLDVVDRVVLTGGPGESVVTAAVRSAVPGAARLVDLAGRTTVGELAALAARSRVVVTNDTGVAHLASAVRAPSVTVCGRSDRPRWAPRGALDRVVGGDPPGRWPALLEVRVAIDGLLAETVRAPS
jgi:ADP-heptose:LPS heptosyltransferase